MENYSQALLICQFRYNPREDVIYVWYMDDNDEDQRLPQHHDPKKFVSLENLLNFFKVCPEKLPNYEEKIKSSFEEHFHTN
ncbi:hypothetical protein RDI58_022743 [Solanum bulbocastanum]|uniref:acireductone dioxygenase (Fe(2+)-requiring) n=1 Tax=Solanum bulbocastanum TaxID=147425 RepID=A0AAN8T6A1_SOLBU